MRKQEAFTLIELLVTFVVLGITLAIAIPAFSVWLPGRHLRSGAGDLYSELQLAKMQAIRDNGEWALVFNAGGGTYQVISGGADGVYSTGGDNVVQKTITLAQYGSGTAYGNGSATTNATQAGGALPGDGISFSEVTGANDNTVVFNSRGMINSTAGGYVYLQNNQNATYAVGVLGSGVIRLKKWDGAAWD
jgi:prepilin-type N-terminal cleavage/methylation domain-containing protein